MSKYDVIGLCLCVGSILLIVVFVALSIIKDKNT